MAAIATAWGRGGKYLTQHHWRKCSTLVGHLCRSVLAVCNRGIRLPIKKQVTFKQAYLNTYPKRYATVF